MICPLCELPVTGENKSGYHPFCYILAAAELAEQIGDTLRADPTYEEIRPGRWRKKEGGES